VLSLTVEELLDELARGTAVPGAGSAAAVVAAVAAALTAMAARCSRGEWVEAGAAVAQAESLRARAGALAPEDADALQAFLALRAAAVAEAPPEVRDYRLGVALFHAADVPLAVAEVACDVAVLAAYVARHCNQDVRPDAASAAALAHGAARAAAHLVEVNLATAAGDERVTSARGLVRASGAAADEAVRETAS